MLASGATRRAESASQTRCRIFTLWPCFSDARAQVFIFTHAFSSSLLMNETGSQRKQREKKLGWCAAGGRPVSSRPASTAVASCALLLQCFELLLKLPEWPRCQKKTVSDFCPRVECTVFIKHGDVLRGMQFERCQIAFHSQRVPKRHSLRGG